MVRIEKSPEQGLEGRGKRILVAEDEAHIGRLVQVSLERAGYGVEYVSNGLLAWQYIQKELPDMLVTDIMMPQMDGYELMRNVRGDPRTQDLSVIMLTAKAQDEDIFKGWEHGCDMYLTKPFNPTELLSFVDRLFKADEQEDPDAYQL